MKKILPALVLMLVNVLPAMAGDGPAVAATCSACHGPAGVSGNSLWPNLAGQKSEYLAIQLRAYRDGSRTNSLMTPVATRLSDTEIADLASYYAAQTAVASASGDPALVAEGEGLSAYCKACHGMKGQTINPQWPNLAGQQAAYIESQLQAFKSGERVSSRMWPVVQRFGDRQFAALAAYYSQLAP